jgi:hypothetical protein
MRPKVSPEQTSGRSGQPFNFDPFSRAARHEVLGSRR